jgi:hypothetical protein
VVSGEDHSPRAKVPSAVTFSLSVSSSNGVSGSFYTDASCTSPLGSNQISIPASSSESGTFYFKPDANGDFSIDGLSDVNTVDDAGSDVFSVGGV